MSTKKEAKQIEYVNKRGQVVRVFPWTLNNRTTNYREIIVVDGDAHLVAAEYVRRPSSDGIAPALEGIDTDPYELVSEGE